MGASALENLNGDVGLPLKALNTTAMSGSNTSMGGDHMLEQKQDPQPDQNNRVALLTKNDDSLKSTGFLVSSLHGRVGQVGTQQSDLAGQSDFNQTTVGRLVNEESDWSEECPVGTKPH